MGCLRGNYTWHVAVVASTGDVYATDWCNCDDHAPVLLLGSTRPGALDRDSRDADTRFDRWASTDRPRPDLVPRTGGRAVPRGLTPDRALPYAAPDTDVSPAIRARRAITGLMKGACGKRLLNRDPNGVRPAARGSLADWFWTLPAGELSTSNANSVAAA